MLTTGLVLSLAQLEALATLTIAAIAASYNVPDASDPNPPASTRPIPTLDELERLTTAAIAATWRASEELARNPTRSGG